MNALAVGFVQLVFWFNGLSLRIWSSVGIWRRSHFGLVKLKRPYLDGWWSWPPLLTTPKLAASCWKIPWFCFLILGQEKRPSDWRFWISIETIQEYLPLGVSPPSWADKSWYWGRCALSWGFQGIRVYSLRERERERGAVERLEMSQGRNQSTGETLLNLWGRGRLPTLALPELPWPLRGHVKNLLSELYLGAWLRSLHIQALS